MFKLGPQESKPASLSQVSKAEDSEAIASMYQRYYMPQFCLVESASSRNFTLFKVLTSRDVTVLTMVRPQEYISRQIEGC
jgi:hypothetical protein